jgi:hypothetical protein
MNTTTTKSAILDKFFGDLQKSLKGKIPNYVKPDGCCYCYFQMGIEGIHLECFFDEKTSSLRIGIHFESRDAKKNKQLFDIIWSFKDIIEKKTAEKVMCLPHERDYWHIIGIEKRNCELAQELKWTARTMLVLYRVIKYELRKISKMLEKF